MSTEAPADFRAPAAGSPAAAATPSRPLRSRGRKLRFALISWCVVAIVVEGGVRVREKIVYGTFSRAGQTLYQKTDTGRVELKPNTDITGTDMQVHVNSLKFRGREVAMPKPAGTVRVVCIGGSTTFDILAKSDSTTWPAQLEKRLREKHPAVEVVNAGVAGYTIDSYLDETLWKKIASLSPDVVVGYFATNEIAEEARHRFEARWLHCPAGDFEQVMADAPGLATCPRCGGKLEGRWRGQTFALGVDSTDTPPWLERAAKTITDWSLAAYKVRLVVDLLRKPPELEGQSDLPESAAMSFEQKLRELARRIKTLGARPALATFALRWRPDQPREKQRLLAAGAFNIYVGLSLEGIEPSARGLQHRDRPGCRERGLSLDPRGRGALGRPQAVRSRGLRPLLRTGLGAHGRRGGGGARELGEPRSALRAPRASERGAIDCTPRARHFSEPGSARMADVVAAALESSGSLGAR